MKTPSSLLDYKNYFDRHTYCIFERRFNAESGFVKRPTMESIVLNIVDSRRKLEDIISGGYDLSSCPFLSNTKKGLDEGGVLLLVFIGKELAHSTWTVMDNPAIMDPISRRIKYADAGYIGPCYTNPAYRGRGMYPYALSEICEFLRKNGKSRALINTKKANLASIRGITKAGFDFFAEASCTRILIWKIYRIDRMMKNSRGADD